MLPFLRDAGFDPHIVFEPAAGTETPEVSALLPLLVAEHFQVIVFQKVHGPSVEALADSLRRAGIKTVFALCDVVDVPMARATDMSVVVTDFLKSLYPPELQGKIRVVHDGIEHPVVHKTDWGRGRGSAARPLRAVLVTSVHLTRLPVITEVPPWLRVAIVGRYFPTRLQRLREVRWDLAVQRDWRTRVDYLRFLGNRRIECVAWDPFGVYARMCEADIGIIPIDTLPAHTPGLAAPSWKVKSENRLTMKMAIGLPVIATPIPSYEPVIEQGHTGFLARSAAEWMACFEQLRDPDRRAAIGTAARQAALRRYSMQEQARLLVAALRELVGKSGPEA
jgi:glycosyltransferase involved in cell wall biosynthesis